MHLDSPSADTAPEASAARQPTPAEAARLAAGLRENRDIAEQLEQVAELLGGQEASPFRVRAYRNAAHRLRELGAPIRQLADARGFGALAELPDVGPSIANAIGEYLASGQIALRRRLEGHLAPEDLFTTLPGIGEELAHRLHDELGVETLEDLEMAAHDGRLERVPGFGARRASALRDVLAARLSRSLRARAQRFTGAEAPVPDVATLLAVDAEYRLQAARGTLRTIAPRRFNPRRERWLPIWHTERDGWHFTALFSNTALAHQLGMTRDWVILYYGQDGHDGQCTVVTERRGSQAGRRVVRGREAECSRHHARRRRAGSVDGGAALA